ncbi:inosine-5-monophosphate dehydrogenase [Candidatus Roizmanbacteria bacterium CG10_big_fil_rev_8_21_14_0_10_45_7]|uniref:Inosine-5-monophosphate dehydrogenase n=1 Tax=Candidatus Roizmanbacteria bacterium CG10_big_fil_rev_8_21_14_0_10_45_7 TaxID=1974854 RepID=A0A2M8KUP5_9BACT|nr:MAG: inosine-5-monophosphate dehydrogenase [Candidatus Roizmanbacteria bacterium CG10_big_fil_rev_8_21_14_0_10_45_7]
MRVKEVMQKKVTTIIPSTSLREIWNLIYKKHIHSLPVVVGKKMVGIISDKDILSKLYPSYEEVISDFVHARRFEDMEDRLGELSGLKAKDIMTTTIYLTYPERPIMRALSKMLLRNIRQMPVVEENQENILIGMISRTDIFRALYKKVVK